MKVFEPNPRIKIKVKGVTKTVLEKKVQTVSAKSSIFPKMTPVEQKRSKSIFGKMAYIIIEDVRSLFGRDKKTREEKMKYDSFMERFGK